MRVAAVYILLLRACCIIPTGIAQQLALGAERQTYYGRKIAHFSDYGGNATSPERSCLQLSLNKPSLNAHVIDNATVGKQRGRFHSHKSSIYSDCKNLINAF